MASAISSYGLEKRLAGGEAVDVGVGEDSGEGEVGDEIFPRPSSLSRSTLPHSPSSWQKVDTEPAFLPTNLMNRVAEAGGGGGGVGGGGGGGGTWGEDWFSSRRFTQAFRLAASRAWRPGPRLRRRRC